MPRDECDVLVCCRYELKRYSLKIDPVYKNDSGRYACLAKNDLGHAWLNFTITVTGTTNTNDVFTFIKRMRPLFVFIYTCVVSLPTTLVVHVEQLVWCVCASVWTVTFDPDEVHFDASQVRKSRRRSKFTVRKILPVVGATSSEGFLAAWITEIKTKPV